jgi:hypothetical protein
VSVPTTTCSNCRAVLPATARFCPECGLRLGFAPAGQPPMRTFNVAPPSALLGLAGLIILLGVVMLALQHWTLAAVLLAIGAVVAALYAGSSDSGAGAQQRVAKARSRGRALLETFSAQSQARRQQLALRVELEQLYGRRGSWLRDLGVAVYGGDDAGTERGKRAIRELDQEIAAKEEQMTQIALQTQERVQQVRAESRPTELLEPPAPAPVPEPYPPPDEGTPPTPAPVPEPYPPPDEGTPPQPR